MDAEKELAALNPAIKEVSVGTRSLRKIKIYPLSMSDQLEFTGIIAGNVVVAFENKDASNITFAVLIHKMVQDNIGKLLAYITDEGEPLLKELTNEQSLAIAEIVYEVNYGIMEKKAAPFVEKLRKLFQPEQLSPQSSAASLNTDTRTSSGDLFEKED
jgi:hypothetical protein